MIVHSTVSHYHPSTLLELERFASCFLGEVRAAPATD